MSQAVRRAVGYVRVSQVGARAGESFLSPDVQRDKIKAWADYRGFTITGWYIDLDRSGREGSDRPEFDRMMADAADKKFDAVAVYRLTRFARSVSQAAARYSELRKLNVALVSVTEDIDTTTASGGLMQNVLFALAEFESQMIGEGWRAVHETRRRRGIAHITAPVLGYEIEGAEITSIIDTEAEAIRVMYRLALGGDGFGRIARKMREQGYKPKRGGDQFSRSTIHAILHNPIYAGLVKIPSTGELLEGRHEAIVTRATWEAVQASMPHTARVSRFGGGLLSGLLICSGCGYRMTFHRHGRTVDGQKRESYRCAAHLRTNLCSAPATISAKAADEYVQHVLLAMLDRNKMPGKGKVKTNRQQATWQRQAKQLRARTEELDQALDQIADRHFLKGSMSDDEYRRQVTRYETERDEVKQEVDELERLARTLQPLNIDLVSFWPNYDLDAKRQVLRSVIGRVSVNGGVRRGRLPADQQERFEVLADRMEIAWLNEALAEQPAVA